MQIPNDNENLVWKIDKFCSCENQFPESHLYLLEVTVVKLRLIWQVKLFFLKQHIQDNFIEDFSVWKATVCKDLGCSVNIK